MTNENARFHHKPRPSRKVEFSYESLPVDSSLSWVILRRVNVAAALSKSVNATKKVRVGAKRMMVGLPEGI